jgi:hypothetical protein
MREYEKTGEAFVKEYTYGVRVVCYVYGTIYVVIIREYENRETVFIKKI